jgi:hypothetical protein
MHIQVYKKYEKHQQLAPVYWRVWHMVAEVRHSSEEPAVYICRLEELSQAWKKEV